MDLNIGIGGNGSFDVSRFGGMEGVANSSTPQPVHTSTPQASGGLTIQTSAAAPEDIAAAGIPESALSRTDALGVAVAQAFDLPPPPMPQLS